MPETKPKAPLTPEELRWRAAARDPDKAERNLKLQYILPDAQSPQVSDGESTYSVPMSSPGRTGWERWGSPSSSSASFSALSITGVFWRTRGRGAISDPLSPQQKPR